MQVVFLRCIESGWTEWMNSYHPTYVNGGDMEIESNLRQQYIYCPNNKIISIECRVVNSHLSTAEVDQVCFIYLTLFS